MSNDGTPPTTPLLRTVGLTQITLYGVGTIVGAGIYVLIGEIALTSGSYMAISFLVAVIVASLSAYSYGQLGRRFPVSAGAAIYALEAFRSRYLASAVGLTIAFGGVVTAATLANGFVGHLALFLTAPGGVIITVLVAAMTAVAANGIRLSMSVAVTTTVLELAGLLAVIIAGSRGWGELLSHPSTYLLPRPEAWPGIGAGTFLAFFALIGFEDMANLAEEIKRPEKNLPRGILLALVITGGLYMLVALATLTAVPLAELISSDAPLALVVARNTAIPASVIAGIGLIAIINGAFLQIIMVARVLYGMGNRRLVPRFLARVDPRTRTPLVATILVGATILILALTLPLLTLAKVTSAAILVVFTVVNLALVRILWRDEKKQPLPLFIASSGAIISAVFLALQL